MNYEHIKSTILIVLIALSVVLTWQLYTFQPEIALLDDTARYVPSDSLLAEYEERKLKHVIKPEQMIVHQNNEHVMVPSHDERFTKIYENLLRSNLSEIDLLATGPFPKELETGGVELIFPTAIPVDLFLSLFEQSEEEFMLALTEVDRLFLYGSPNGDVHMQILSIEEERVIELGTTLTSAELGLFLEPLDELIQVRPVLEPSSSYSTKLSADIYISTEPIQASRLSFQTSPLSTEFYKQTLFTDPGSVKYYQQSDGEDSYTDGNRIITMQNNGLFMEYINPVFIESQEKTSKHIVQGSYEFVNGHGGWSDDYLLAEWSSNDLRDEASFLLHVHGYPVLNFEGQGSMSLHISRSGNQVVNYIRPLFELDNAPIDVSERVDLPSGEEVLEHLNEQEFFDPERLNKLVVGYEMVTRTTSFVTIEPHWFALYGNRWQKVTFEEGGTNGLE
ncbi:YycH family regulatory protein [Halalkalibacter alkalisediminis]|uniref:YycH family regulatory protein n=1 Tax=Halalkalibacter alkalisediminis TaxID=935616 RepID=A0ABV6NKP1_9BACI|nr:two-component system activity regulator YycH [Halalkalibacter alkalisediminis]